MMRWKVPNSVKVPQRPSWLGELLANLERSGPVGQGAARYLNERRVRLRIRRQSAGARWTLGGNIELHPRYAEAPPDAPYPLSLLVHETRHLQQGIVAALSVYGELDAWQAQFTFLKTLGARPPGSENRARVIAQLLALPLGWDRGVLRTARRLMKAYAGKRYRIELLPLYPLPKELTNLLFPKPDENLDNR
jgi:hypothetical protein